MRMVRIATGAAVAAAIALGPVPATAQFFLKAKDLSGERVNGDEPGIGQPMPGATPAELKAGVTWNMRAALNVAALQCQFEPTLLTVPNYNAILADHRDELKASFDTLTKYFTRTNKTAKLGQSALDQFGTRTYAGFATVSAQFNFCRTAALIGRDALFTPRGGFGELSLQRMRELRNSLTPWGEQQFPQLRPTPATLPRFDRACWSKDNYNVKRCGDPLVPYAYAAN